METEEKKLEGYRKLLTAWLPMLGALLAAITGAGVPVATLAYLVAGLAATYIVSQGAVDFAKELGKAKAAQTNPEAIAGAALAAVLAALKNAGLNLPPPGANNNPPPAAQP